MTLAKPNEQRDTLQIQVPVVAKGNGVAVGLGHL